MRNINNYVRSYAKGKSFEFTEWSKLNNYTNSGIKQDFVTYGGSLYACICDVAAGNEPPDKDTKHWKLAVVGSYTKREDIIKLLGFEPVNLEGSNDFGKEQTFSGGISLNNTNIKEVADPEDSSDAATKNYVDQQITFRKGTGEGSARLDSSTASGDYSVAEGIQTIAYNPGEHAEGVLNVSKRKEDVDDESYTIHSVGIGNDQEGSLDRKNAWEILKTGEAYLYGIGGYDGKNSEAHGSENAPKSVQKELLKIADPFSGVFCMKLGKSGSLTTEEVAAIREKLAYMIDNEKFYLVSIYDDVDKRFRGDCEIIRESSKNSYLIMQITAATTPTFIITTYTFYADNTYTRNQYTSSLKSYSAGDGIAIDKDRKISCTIDTTLFRVVGSLPGTPAKGDENKLHIVKESTIEGELFSEYLWVNGKWERLGSPKSTTALDAKQDKLIAGNGIQIEENEIGITSITESETQPDTSLWINPSEDTEVELTYNRSQIGALVNSKQDIISDLEDIRQGAELGSTALQEHQDISHLATKTDLTNSLTAKQDTIEDLAEIRSGASKGATAVQPATLTGELNKKADKVHTHTTSDITDFPSIPSKTSELTNDSGFLTTVPDEYITETELDAKGYLTKHQDISHLATTEEVENKLATKQNTLTDNDGGYGQRIYKLERDGATKTYVNNAIASAIITALNTEI